MFIFLLTKGEIMLKLMKIKATQWQGNHNGFSTADWVVKGHPHILISTRSTGWWTARDMRACKTLVHYGDSRKDCVAQLEAIKLAWINNVY